MYDPRGSVWRKWDLQVQPIKHEWFTDLRSNQQSINQAAEEYVKSAHDSRISTIAITDHNSGAAIDSVINNEFDVSVLPGVELDSKEGWHIVVVFNPEYRNKLKLDSWNDTVENFLSNICSIQRPFHDENGVAKGIEVTSVELLAKLHSENIGIPIFAHCYSNDGFFKKANKKSRKAILQLFKDDKSKFIFEIKDNKEHKAAIRKKISDISNIDLPIPIISSTDAHQAKDVGKCFTWIKADTEYEGLRQILIEPFERVEIFNKPQKISLVDQNKTIFISKVKINKKSDAKEKEVWFENLKEIPLNYDLVAIIGNKGSGKSALTDIIGLVGHSKRIAKFSFLNTEKFRNRKRNKANSYEASLTWKDGSFNAPIGLETNPERYESELVKYLPQNSIEELCNPVTKEERDLFEHEIKSVIFSWVPDSERYSKTTLDDIIEYRSELARKKVQEIRVKIRDLNKQIIELENKLISDYKKNIESDLVEKKKELKSHLENKPQKVDKPDKQIKDDEKFKEIFEQLESLQEDKKFLIKRRDEYNELLKRINIRIEASKRIVKSGEMVQKYVRETKTNIKDDLKILGLNFDEVINVKINTKNISHKQKRLAKLRLTVKKRLEGKASTSINNKLKSIEKLINELEEQLDEPNKKYQKYIKDLENWEEKHKQIIGAKEDIGTLKYLENEINQIKTEYPAKKENLIDKRKKQVLLIHAEYQNLKTIYSDLYEPVTNFVNTHREFLENFLLTFDVSIDSIDFKKEFLNKIHLGVVGSFQGESDANELVDQIHDSTDFNDSTQLINFLDTIDNRLHKNRHTKKELDIGKQLKDGNTPQTLYDFLYELTYLQPAYQLKLDGKELYQLSPGERGILLLIFYLLIDRDPRPLIIDQPEENLDNETVYRVLVRCIREAKSRRQVIIVTHNPNLAVVCDAEQIIIADIDKQNGNEVKYTTGAIENPKINKRVIDILEGTRPAFDNRDAKYLA